MKDAMNYVKIALPYIALTGIVALYKLGVVTGDVAVGLAVALGLPSPVAHAIGLAKGLLPATSAPPEEPKP